MLRKGPAEIPPTAAFCRRLKWKLQQLLLPCDWHHGFVLFIRSQKALRLERDRQMRSGHCLVWHPCSPIKFSWDCFFMVFTAISLMYMPMQVFLACPSPYDAFILLGDFLAFVDIITKFFTGYNDEDEKIIVLEPRQIAKHYLRGGFVYDLIGVLPLQLIQPYEDCVYPSHTVMYIFKLFRLPTTDKQWRSLVDQLELSFICSTASTSVFRMILFLQWITFAQYQVPALLANVYTARGERTELPSSKENAWLRRYRVGNYTALEKYMTNLYYVCGVCIGAGYYSPLEGTHIPEVLLNAVIGLIGLPFITYISMGLLSLVIYKRNRTHMFNGKLKEMEDYIVWKQLPRSLQQKVKLFINYKFTGKYYNEESILSTINEQIKHDVNLHCCRRLVLGVPLFQSLPVSIVNSIIFSLTQALYMPGEVVIEYGQPERTMYVISSGCVAVFDSNGKETVHLQDGEYFGVNALLNPGDESESTVIVLEITEMYMVRSAVFQAHLQPHPHLKRRLVEASRAPVPPRRRRRSKPNL